MDFWGLRAQKDFILTGCLLTMVLAAGAAGAAGNSCLKGFLLAKQDAEDKRVCRRKFKLNPI